MAAPKGNQFRAKPDGLRRDDSMTLRLSPEERAAMDAAAGPEKVTAWARTALIRSAAEKVNGGRKYAVAINGDGSRELTLYQGAERLTVRLSPEEARQLSAMLAG